ncbi:MAG: hypothetical protein ACYDH6_19580 [Acidimicrobiales bacterium]
MSDCMSWGAAVTMALAAPLPDEIVEWREFPLGAYCEAALPVEWVHAAILDPGCQVTHISGHDHTGEYAGFAVGIDEVGNSSVAHLAPRASSGEALSRATAHLVDAVRGLGAVQRLILWSSADGDALFDIGHLGFEREASFQEFVVPLAGLPRGRARGVEARRAQHSDLPAVVSLLKDRFRLRDDASADGLANFCRWPWTELVHEFVVPGCDGVVGHLLAYPSGGDVFVCQLAMDRSAGLLRSTMTLGALADRVREVGDAAGARDASGLVHPSNTRAWRIYKAFGARLGRPVSFWTRSLRDEPESMPQGPLRTMTGRR